MFKKSSLDYDVNIETMSASIMELYRKVTLTMYVFYENIVEAHVAVALPKLRSSFSSCIPSSRYWKTNFL